MKRKQSALILAAILGVAVAAAPVAPSSSSAEAAVQLSASALEQPSTSLLPARLSVSTDFETAVQIASEFGESAVGVRFENDQVVGEYYFDSDKSPAEFLEQFEEMYGTVPQAAALVVAVPYRDPAVATEQKSTKDTISPLPIIEVEGPAFEAPPVPDDAWDALRAKARGTEPVDAEARVAAPSTTWFPQTVYAGTYRSGNSQYFYNSLDWYTPRSPKVLAGPYAVEIEIKLTNGATGTRGSIIPGQICGPNFRDKFIAKNYNLNSWSVSSPLGSVANAYPYADLNDLSDSCGENAMAVGLASAYDLPVGPPGPNSSLETFIDAKRGTTSSSGINGLVQLANNSTCPFDGSIAYTDCVGLLPISSTFESNRLTLNRNRNWTASPNRCWVSGNYASSAPVDEGC